MNIRLVTIASEIVNSSGRLKSSQLSNSLTQPSILQEANMSGSEDSSPTPPSVQLLVPSVTLNASPNSITESIFSSQPLFVPKPQVTQLNGNHYYRGHKLANFANYQKLFGNESNLYEKAILEEAANAASHVVSPSGLGKFSLDYVG